MSRSDINPVTSFRVNTTSPRNILTILERPRGIPDYK